MVLWYIMPFSFLGHLKWKTCTITALEHGRSINSECMNNLVTFVFNFVFRSESSSHFYLNFVIFVLDMLGISIIPSVIPASRGSALPIPCWMTDVVARAVAPNGFWWAVAATIETKSMATQKPEFLGKADNSSWQERTVHLQRICCHVLFIVLLLSVLRHIQTEHSHLTTFISSPTA